MLILYIYFVFFFYIYICLCLDFILFFCYCDMVYYMGLSGILICFIIGLLVQYIYTMGCGSSSADTPSQPQPPRPGI